MKKHGFSTHEHRRCCEAKLGIDFVRTGNASHGWFKKNKLRIRRITVLEGKHLIGKGLQKSMASQLGLTTDQFDDLLGCSLKKEEYEEILRGYGMM
ncbi:MAG: hypothetical protein JSV01_02535 [Desulfobacterales bacterium]|nr:MAG: hypothetical protein JSV01_02535 [Desulfobacterales bacterium]